VANHIYPRYLSLVLHPGIDLTDGNVVAALVNNSASYNSANTDFSSLSGNQVGGSVTPGSPTVTGAVFSANSVTFSSISAGLYVQAIVLYHVNGGAKDLIAWLDTGTGLPITSTSGANITVDWNGSSPSGTIITATGP